jgi:hypothetical protein
MGSHWHHLRQMPRTRAAASQTIEERDLRGWKVVARFQKLLAEARGQVPPTARENHGLRQLGAAEYLGLFLLGVYNPVVPSMRALCAASHFERVQAEVGTAGPVALSRFSEAQEVFDPELLRCVMQQLVAESGAQAGASCGGLNREALRVVDSTLWKVIPRMEWAHWRHQSTKQQALRLHVKLRLWDGAPVEATVTNGKGCERAALRAKLVPGEIYVGDRYFGEDYGFFAEMDQKGCGFLLRLRNEAVLHWETEEPLSEADRAAGVVRAGLARLGARSPKGPWRVVQIERPGAEAVILVASACLAALSPAEIGALYRERWQVELFFRWLKCLLPCRHWFAESERGVNFQIYLSLICALLMARAIGQRPSKRMLELIAWHQSGVASDEELRAGLERETRAIAQRAAAKARRAATKTA